MYLLKYNDLKIGDIILLRSDSNKSKLIRKFSDSEYSHAMIYVGSSLIDADAAGVHSHNPQRVLFDKEDDAIVLRHTTASSRDLRNVEQFLRSKIGTAYSMEEARKVVQTSEKIAEGNRQFCTRLIGQAYFYAGVDILKNRDFCSPKDIEESNVLNRVHNIAYAANEKEIEFAQSESPLDIQEQSTNQFIAKVRQLTGQDIQTFEQINALLISEPHFDKEIVEILETSNYLTLWKIEFEKNPWYYDYEKFKKKHSKNQSESAARIMVITFKDLYQRFTPMENYYQENFKKTGLVFFKKLFELYTKLNELNNLRLTVAMDAMIDAGLSENEIMEIAQ